MRKYKTHFYGEEIDLDDLSNYDYLPNNCNLLDDIMFRDIGYAIAYMDYIHWDVYSVGGGWQQRKRVKKLIENFIENRINNYGNVNWYKEQVFLFQDEIENMC